MENKLLLMWVKILVNSIRELKENIPFRGDKSMERVGRQGDKYQ